MLAAIIVTSVILGFSVFFTALWLLVTSLIGLTSGWYSLMKRYPDSGELALTTLTFQTARMGAARFNNILTLASCPSGLRVRLPKIFSPFGQNILVPWSDLSTRRATLLFGVETVIVSFGGQGNLQIYDKTAEQLAAASAGRWAVTPLQQVR